MDGTGNLLGLDPSFSLDHDVHRLGRNLGDHGAKTRHRGRRTHQPCSVETGASERAAQSAILQDQPPPVRSPCSHLDEHFRVEGRRTWHQSIDEMQVSLDGYLLACNAERAHQGRGMNGRTPLKAFIDGIPKPQTEKEETPRKRKTTTERKAA